MKIKRCKWEIITILCIMFLSIVIFHQYLIDGYYFFSKGLLSDLLRANLPTYYHLFDSITEGGFFWSWQMGIGTSMFTHADVYFDPFTYILFIFGRDYIPNMMIWSFLVKLICEGAAFFAFLRYFKIDSRAITIASVLYAFSGYSLIMGSNFALGTIMVYAPIIFLSAEKWMETGKIRLLAVALFLTCIYSYYFFYSMGIILVIYICVRLHQIKQNPIPKILILGLLAMIIIFLSAISIFPQIQLTLNSARVSGDKDIAFGFSLFVPQITVWLTAIIRTLGNNLLGNPISSMYIGNGYFNAQDYFQVSCFVSACFIILIMHYWYYEKSKRKSIFSIFTILSLLIIFPVFSYVLNAMSTINARWMFIIVIVQCVGIGLSIDSIIKHKGLHKTPLFFGILISLMFVLLGYLGLGSNKGNYSEYFVYGKKFIIVMLSIYICVIFIYIIQNKYIKLMSKNISKYIIYSIISFIILLDLGVNYQHFYGSSNSISEYTEENNCNYQDTSAEIINKLKKQDNSFYRINKEFDSVIDNFDIPSENDAMVQGYYGLKNYNSVNNPNYIKFLQKSEVFVANPIGIQHYIDSEIKPEEIVGSELNYINGVGDRYQLMSYLGVKYVLIKDEEIELPSYLKLMFKEKDISVFKNQNNYPLAFCNKGVMSIDEYESLSKNEKDIALLNYTIKDADNKTDIYKSAKKSLSDLLKMAKEKQNAIKMDTFSNDNIKFSINVDEGMEYLSFLIPYDKDWKVYIDGVESKTEEINISLLGAKISPGQHEIEIKYEPFMIKAGLIISLITLCLVLLTQSRWEKWFHLLENEFRNFGIKFNDKFVKLRKRNFSKTKLLVIIKYLCLLFVSISFSIITIFIIKPNTFIKVSNTQMITDWNLLEVNGYKINDNTFTAIKDDASVKVPVKLNYTNVTIEFEAIDYIANQLDNLNIQMYYSERGEELEPDKVIFKDASLSKLKLNFRHNGENQSNLRLDFGSYKNDSFTLKRILLNDETFQMNAIDYILTLFGTIISFIAFTFFLNKLSSKAVNTLERSSNIELCRVICMLLIIAHHFVIHGGSVNMDGMGGNRIISLFLLPAGKLCFDAFLAISCWFLVDQNFRMKRFIKIWLLVFFYSVTFAIVASIAAGTTVRVFISTLLPITGNSHGYAASYMALYLLLPFLSIISKNLNKMRARWLMFILLYFQVGANLIGNFNHYWQPLYSELLLFVLMYFIALNLKKWPLKICSNKKIMLSIVAAIWLGLWFFRYSYIINSNNKFLGFVISTMFDESSITNIVGGFAIFFFFKELKVKSLPFVNWLATGTFGILLIHDHNLFRYILWEDIIKTEKWNNSPMFLLGVISAVIWIFIVCFLIDRFRSKYLETPIMKHPKINQISEKFDIMLNSKKKDKA